MAAFRLIDKCRTFFGSTGQLLAAGYLKFYDADTTTPKDVYGEKELSTNNGDTIDLDLSGRPEFDIWGEDGYFVEVYDEDDVKQGEIQDLEIPGGAALTLPLLEEGEFLTGDGVSYLAATIREVPDPTGQTNKILGNDGSSPLWVAKPADGADGTSDTSSTSTGFSVGDMHLVTGSATGTNAGGRTQSVSVTYATAFTSTPVWIGIDVTSGSLSSFGNMPSWAITASSTTGFTVKFTLGELDDSQSGFDFNAGVPFSYAALGVRT